MSSKRDRHPGRRVLALALCLAILCPLLGSPGYAEITEDGLCEHHPAHTADCGFSAGSPESPCGHIHNEACYTVLCLHEGEEGHVCSEESGCLTLACAHVHDESCGYAPEIPAAPCQFHCPVCAGEETPEPTETPDPTETPEPTESPDPSEEPLPSESSDPAESPGPSESPEPSEEPALPVMTLSGAELTDAESGELLWSWASGEEPEDALWPLQGEQLLTLRVDCPAVPESEASRQLRLSLSPLLRLTGWEEAEGLSFLYGPLDEEGAPPVSGGELFCTLEPAVPAVELKLRLAADGEAWEARNAAAEEAAALPEELLRAELLVNGEAPEEPALLLKGFMDPGVSLMAAAPAAYTTPVGDCNFANLVLFAYFNDQESEASSFYKDPAKAGELYSYYEGSNGRSFKNYIRTISYGKMRVLDVFPQYDPDTGTINAAKLPYNSSEAYKNIDTAIIDAVIASVNVDGGILDLDSNGTIDNVTVILLGGSGDTESDGASYHAHKSDYPGSKRAFGKQLLSYNMLNTHRLVEELGKSGSIAHEFLHTLGFSDLYNNGSDYPVHSWDIMARSGAYPSWPLAYTRMQRGWVSLPTYTESTVLTLSAPGTGDGSGQAAILRTPQNDHEFFVVEMRRRNQSTGSEDTLDAMISSFMDFNSSGLIVYRVNTNVEGLSNHYRETGIYIFRPTGHGDESINVQYAFLNESGKRTTVGSADLKATQSQGALTFSDGTNSGIVIRDVKTNPDGTMSCQVEMPDASQFDTWTDTDFPTQADGNKAVSIASCGGKLYTVSYLNGKFSLYRMENSGWVEIGSAWNEPILAGAEIQLAVYEDKLYLAYSPRSGAGMCLKVFDPASASWSGAGRYGSDYNGFSMNAVDGGLYISCYGPSSAALLRYTGSGLEPVGNYFSGSGGQAYTAQAGGKLYVSIRRIDNCIEVYRCDGSGSFIKVSDDTISSSSYGLVALNDQLRVVTAGSSTTVYSYTEGAGWKAGNPFPMNCFEPNLTVAQGNLYMVAGSTTGKSNTYVYQYDPTTDTWIPEGEAVDAAAQHITLTAEGDCLYVSYVLSQGDGGLHVRKKVLVNQLESISVTKPTKTDYTLGEEVSTAGMTVTAHYKRGDEVLTGGYTVTGFDTDTPGSREATVSYGGKTASFQYTVSDKVSKLGQPRLVSLSDPGTGLVFTWAKTAGALQYQVYVKTPAKQEWTAAGKPVSGTSFTYKPSQAGTYAFTVEAQNGEVKSSYDQAGLSIAYEPLKLTLTPPSGYGDAYIYIDGKEYAAQKSGGSYSMTLPDAKGKTAVMYKKSGDVPTGMAVWLLSYQGTKVTATELKGLRDLISYHGFSIRIQAPAGIRFKSGISEATRAKLLAGGVDGCRLLEYGTLFMTKDNWQKNHLPFVKGGTKVGGGRAYWSERGKVTDLIYERVSGRLRFTSVLINLAPDMYSVALAFRGYAILERNGEQLIIYGPPVSRSVADVAKQVMSAREFAPGSAGYNFVQNIIKRVERG